MRFFKVMIGDFCSKLSIPPAFSRKLLNRDEKMEKVAVLTTCRGSWDVGVVKCGPLFHFKLGWEEFVQNHDLNEGDFLVFEHNGSMRFDVLVFDPTGCEKRLSGKSHRRPAAAGKSDGICDHPRNAKRVKVESDSGVSHKRFMAPGKNNSHHHVKQSSNRTDQTICKCKHEESGGGGGAVSSGFGRPSFTSTIRSSNLTRRCPNIPRHFSRSKDVIISTGERIIILRDKMNRMWPVKVTVEKRDQRIRLGRGWLDFCRGNNLKTGDVCIFELNPTSPQTPHPLLDVRILK